LIVTHDGGALLRHRTGHLLAGFAGRGCVADTYVAIAHDGYPLLRRNTNAQAHTKLHGVPLMRPGRCFGSWPGFSFASGPFSTERLKTRRSASNPNARQGVSRPDGEWRRRMRALSYIIALAFVLTGPSLAGSDDRDMPGVGTFIYCGSPVVTIAPDSVAVISQ